VKFLAQIGLSLTAAVTVCTFAYAQEAPRKRALPVLDAPACAAIRSAPSTFAEDRTTRTTQYFTPVFQPGPDGGLRDEDRRNCLNIEGSCIVGDYLYNTGGPSGVRYRLDAVHFVFGKGSGVSDFNRTNALFPCRTLAADRNHYRAGTVIYIPSFEGRICPQNGQPVDGCFIVGDVGSAIRGEGRFDIFTGECINYDGRRNVCRDPQNAAFDVPPGTRFRIVPRRAALAYQLRSEADAFILNGWR
jgi:3D (Asp-Asp-Asp) domain-containing protein